MKVKFRTHLTYEKQSVDEEGEPIYEITEGYVHIYISEVKCNFRGLSHVQHRIVF